MFPELLNYISGWWMACPRTGIPPDVGTAVTRTASGRVPTGRSPRTVPAESLKSMATPISKWTRVAFFPSRLEPSLPTELPAPVPRHVSANIARTAVHSAAFRCIPLQLSNSSPVPADIAAYIAASTSRRRCPCRRLKITRTCAAAAAAAVDLSIASSNPANHPATHQQPKPSQPFRLHLKSSARRQRLLIRPRSYNPPDQVPTPPIQKSPTLGSTRTPRLHPALRHHLDLPGVDIYPFATRISVSQHRNCRIALVRFGGFGIMYRQRNGCCVTYLICRTFYTTPAPPGAHAFGFPRFCSYIDHA